MYEMIVLEDEKITLEWLCEKVTELDDQFHIAGSFSRADRALEYVKNHHVDAALLDINMPGLSGLDLAEQIAACSPHTLMVIVSGYGNFQYAHRAINCGVIKYLLKPVEIQELKDTLNQLRKRLEENSVQRLRTKDFSDEQQMHFFKRLLSTDGDPMGDDRYDQPVNGYVIRLDDKRAEGERMRKLKESAIAITNVLRMIEPYVMVQLLSAEDDRLYYAILFGKMDASIRLQYIIQRTWELLHLSVSAQILKRFDALNQLPSILWHAGVKTESAVAGMTEYPDDKETDPIIAESKKFIQQHYGRDISRDEVARAVYRDPSYFSHYFKQKTGKSYMDYLTEVRMKRAIELLRQGLSVTEISGKVGYYNKRYFSLLFKTYTGYTPADYRKFVLTGGTNE